MGNEYYNEVCIDELLMQKVNYYHTNALNNKSLLAKYLQEEIISHKGNPTAVIKKLSEYISEIARNYNLCLVLNHLYNLHKPEKAIWDCSLLLSEIKYDKLNIKMKILEYLVSECVALVAAKGLSCNDLDIKFSKILQGYRIFYTYKNIFYDIQGFFALHSDLDKLMKNMNDSAQSKAYVMNIAENTIYSLDTDYPFDTNGDLSFN